MSTPGRKLYDAGWRQGSRIKGRLAQAHYRAVGGEISLDDFPVGMELILVTQDCDLVKPDERLPYVEVLGCVEDPTLARTVRPNNARYFVADPAVGLVVDRAFGAVLTRSALAVLPAPESPCGGDATRARRLARWLGARYDRIPLPDAAVEVIQRPLTAAIGRICGPGRARAQLNHDLHEVRLLGDLDHGPPFHVVLLFVLTEQADRGECDIAIAEVLEATGFAVEGVSDDDGESDVLIRRWVAEPPSRLSLAAYHQSVPISLEYESLRGEESVGAPPLDAESA